MKLYTINDLNQGSGLFDHVMRSSREYDSRHVAMPGEVGIGFVAAAGASGLKYQDVTEVIHGYFDEETAEMLKAIRGMYLGDDERIHLWGTTDDGKMRLHSGIRQYCHPRWRLDDRNHFY